MSGYYATPFEVLYSYSAGGTQLASFTTEANLMGTYPACRIPGSYFSKTGFLSSSLHFRAYGQAGSTGTPTYTYSLRLVAVGSSDPAWSASGLLLGTSAAATMGSGLTLAVWQADIDIVLRSVSAAGSATTTVATMGTITGAAFPASASLPANNTAPTLATIDNSQTYSLFLSVACSASSASNVINCQMAKLYGEN